MQGFSNAATVKVQFVPVGRNRREWMWKARDEESNDLVGYFGDDPGDPLIAPAGQHRLLLVDALHRSGPNTTDRMRRLHVAQDSAAPILNKDGSRPRRLAEPLVVNGKRVT